MLKGRKGFRGLGTMLGLSVLTLALLTGCGPLRADAAVDNEAQQSQARQDLMVDREAVAEFLRTVESFNERRLALQARQRALNIGIDQDAGGADRDPWEVFSIWSAIGGLLDEYVELEQSLLRTPAPNEQAAQVIELYLMAMAQERWALTQWREYVLYGKGGLDSFLVSFFGLSKLYDYIDHRQAALLIIDNAQRLARGPATSHAATEP